MRNKSRIILVLLLIGLMFGVAMAAPTAPKKVTVSYTPKLYGKAKPTLYAKLQSLPDDADISTIVMLKDYSYMPKAKEVLEKFGKIKYEYRIIPAFAVEMKVKDVKKLATPSKLDKILAYLGLAPKIEGLAFIEDDFKVKIALDYSTTQVLATTMWQLGYDGSGITVAVIDTGIDASHPDLQGKVIGWYDVVNGKTTPYDDNGHGTHVASIIAGTGAASNGKYKGVAPGAKLVGVKVLAADGSGSISDIIAGVDWVVQNKDTYGIRVINLSLGSSQSSNGTDSLSQAVNNAWDAGLVVCVAAGNSGPDTYTIGSPAAASKVITVGAVDDNDVIADFSSRGPTADGRLKPEVVAPGVNIIAARAAGTSMGTPIDDYYTSASGTSMATPHVAGIAALLLQAHPSWTPDQVKKALVETADIVAPTEIADIAYGAGRVNAYKAYLYGDSNYETILTFTGYVADKGSQTHTVDVGSGAERIIAYLTWDTSSSDIDLYLYDPNGNQVDYSYTAYYGFEKVGYTSPAAGTWTIKVQSYSGAANYNLEVIVEGASADSGTTPTEPTPTEPTVDEQTFTGYVHDIYDRYDTFTVTVNSGATLITGDLSASSSHDLDLYLYDPNGNIVDRSTSYTSTEHVEYSNPIPGDWTFLVYAYNTVGWAYYELLTRVYYG
ncbi:alkaline serine protease [Thermococcus sp. M39]|uniref:S8 family serine peptidase n=1 Tax=Thermococcus sp. M39 TaxID=1638262 RepID=UPI00143B7E0B|nr:S8 family serine peptidase [Thermococcus sp. M39]NJE08460.1 alkaline serine protease [Thermococcus sp. M39]